MLPALFGFINKSAQEQKTLADHNKNIFFSYWNRDLAHINNNIIPRITNVDDQKEVYIGGSTVIKLIAEDFDNPWTPSDTDVFIFFSGSKADAARELERFSTDDYDLHKITFPTRLPISCGSSESFHHNIVAAGTYANWHKPMQVVLIRKDPYVSFRDSLAKIVDINAFYSVTADKISCDITESIKKKVLSHVCPERIKKYTDRGFNCSI
jgi:hypothetical protein